ncbi:diguanylate cyclase [Geodermatophilus sp. SYSU D00758]
MTSQGWALVYAAATGVAVVTAVLAWRWRHRTPAATALAVTMAATATWSAADALLHTVGTDAVRSAYPPVLLASVGVVVVGIHALARTVADPSWRPARRTAALLAVEPVLLVVTASLPATRDLVMADLAPAGPGAVQEIAFGPVFAVHTAYSYAVLGVAYWHLLRRWATATGPFRRQVAVLIGSGLLSTAGNVLAVVVQPAGSGVDVTPVFFAVTGLVDCWALLRLGLLRLVPVAREQVVDTVPDAVLVEDPAGLLVDLNPAARRLLRALRPGLGEGELVGRPLAEVAGERATAALDRVERREGSRLAEIRPGLWLDVRDTPVSDPRGRPLGRILVVRDVSEQQARQRAVEDLNRELAERVHEIDRLRAELAEEAVRDPLTGLHNRRYLDRVLTADGPRHGQLALLAVDVDHFKRVNDRHGHAAGDTVLVAVARRLAAAVRDGDTVARLGGEEFLLVLPGAGRAEAVRRAEQVRRDVAATTHVLAGERLRVTVSVGVAVRPDDGTSPAALLVEADRALYAAKAGGRDRVVAARPADVLPVAAPAGAFAEPVAGGCMPAARAPRPAGAGLRGDR